jgi:hypothetical protein
MSELRTRSVDEIKVAALEKAKAAFRGNTGLARALSEAGCDEPPTPQAISQWKQVPVDRVGDVEAASGVSRHLLRPDIFGLPEDASIIDGLFADLSAAAGG